ncbi:dTDP-4-dehydrorhamnose 3,5-epimerase [Singulisphaera sp. GP187]|uniref:dTDP-4-dehydrorhamnose 3,5-epimerase n=1 Tax=Singulisphaera sp. GP187 TaxID=1882752 RepID=UPI0020B164E0|nr:dTDP-4-dehydrorhamnose 3,5-epimerase [Singulisphaera sp. GP187]
MIDDAIVGTVPAALSADPQAQAPSVPKHRWLRLMVRAGSYALGFGLLGWALWKNQASVREVIGREPNLRDLAAALVLGEVALLSTFARWYLLARVQGVPLTLRQAVRIGFLGHASELIVPGQLGGDVVKVAAFGRGQGQSRAPLVASVMFDRVTGILGLFLLVSLMGALQWPTAAVAVRKLIAVVWAVAGAGLLGFAALFLPATAVLLRRILGEGRMSAKLAGLWDAAAAYRGHPRAVVAALAMAMASHAIYAFAFYAVICALFPIAPPLSTSLVIIPLILFTAIAPLPFGALGVGEEVSGELFGMIGHSIGTPAMLAARCVGLGLSCVSVLVSLASSPAFFKRNAHPDRSSKDSVIYSDDPGARSERGTVARSELPWSGKEQGSMLRELASTTLGPFVRSAASGHLPDVDEEVDPGYLRPSRPVMIPQTETHSPQAESDPMHMSGIQLQGPVILEPRIFRDERGYFLETWNQSRSADAGIPSTFVQDNLSHSKQGVLRGLHYQHPAGQGKLVMVLQGEIYDVAVDIRAGSPTFGQWMGLTLSAADHRQLYIPPGFAHGFVVTSEFAVFMYKCTEFYRPEFEGSVAWDDPDLAIQWPVAAPILAAKDRAAPRLRAIAAERLPVWGGGMVPSA